MDNIISVDIETSSSELDGQLISIGLVNLKDGEGWYGQAKFRKGLFIVPEAMLVNKITIEQLND